MLCTAQGFPQWLALGDIVLGYTRAVERHGEDGVRKMLNGIAAHRATGAEFLLPLYLGFLGEAYGQTGAIADGLRSVEESLALINKNDERFFEAELHRLKGQLTLQQWSVASSELSVPAPRPLTPDPQAEAEACFLKAIDVARRQQAKSWELRATTSLARLWQRQGKRTEARQMLADIYNWFTEGFDTTDLKEAKALLAELE
jgi:predicted ATPase